MHHAVTRWLNCVCVCVCVRVCCVSVCVCVCVCLCACRPGITLSTVQQLATGAKFIEYEQELLLCILVTNFLECDYFPSLLP